MDILAKKDMLRIIVFFIGISILAQGLVFADDRGMSFFKAEDQEEDCKGCIKEGSILSIGLKKKVEEVEKETTRSFTDKGEMTGREIILFVDPESSFSDGAVNALVNFKQSHPGWKCKAVMITGLRGLKDRLLQKRNYFTSDIEFSIDINGKEAGAFGITITPSYVIICRGKQYKIAGQPDLDETTSGLDK